MTLGQKQELFAEMLAGFILWLYDSGYKVRVGEVWRSDEMQKIYLEQGKSTVNHSRHQDKLAADLYITKDGQLLESKESLQAVGDYWEKLNIHNKWGGNYKSFVDAPHFEYLG